MAGSNSAERGWPSPAASVWERAASLNSSTIAYTLVVLRADCRIEVATVGWVIAGPQCRRAGGDAVGHAERMVHLKRDRFT